MTAHDVAFYESAVQVLLVLTVVLGLEARVFGRPGVSQLLYWIYGVAFAFIVAGMLIALRVLQAGHPDSSDPIFVWVAIGVGIFIATLLASPLASQLDNHERNKGSKN